MKSSVLSAAGLLTAFLFSASAEAAGDVSVVVVAEGPDARAAREEISANLESAYAVVDPSKFNTALGQQGQKGALAPALGVPKKRQALFDKVRSAEKTAQVDEVVIVVTTRTRSGRKTAGVYVVDALGQEPSELHAAVATHEHALAAAVSKELVRLHPAPVSPPPSAPPPVAASAPLVNPATPALVQVDAPAPAPESPGFDVPDQANDMVEGRPIHRVGREWFDLAAGIEGGMRHFTYNQGLSSNLRSYTLNAAPMATLDGVLYPLADAHVVPFSDLGLVLGYARAFEVTSQAAGSAISTDWQRFQAGGRVRIRTSKGPRAIIVGLTGAYSGETFTFSNASTSYPSVDYRFVNADADVRVPIGRFAITADGGYLFVVSGGDVESRFPHASIGGIEADLGGAVRIVPGLEARLNVGYRRFFYSMNPVPGDSYVAGGAVDEFWRLNGSLAYVY